MRKILPGKDGAQKICHLAKGGIMDSFKKLGFGIVAFVLVCILYDTTFAQKKIEAVFVTWEPYGYIENNQFKGFELDIFSAVMAIVDIPVEYSERPWKRCLYLVEYGLADVVISAIKTPEREQVMIYPEAFISVSKTALFTTVDRDVRFNNDLDSLRDYTIGTTAGFSYGEAFDAADFLRKDDNTKTAAIVTKLLMGRYELGIGNIPVIVSIALKQGVRHKIRFVKPLIHSEKLYPAFSKVKNHQRLVKTFSDSLNSYKKSNGYRKILMKYGIPYDSQQP